MNQAKAVFMIYLIIAMSFIIYSTPEVSAQQNACCQYTQSAEACVYTDVSQCASGLKSFTSCDNTDYCKLGCCINTEEGTCSANVGKSLCLKQGFTWDKDSTCNIAQCQPGCCRLGTECSFITQQRCVIEASQFPGLKPIFEEAIQTEEACINSCKSLEKGACVFADKNCELTSRVECTEGTFHANLLCSNPALGTICAQQQYTNCLKEDVYWFDSCGNPENPYHSNKEVSYNNGILIPERQIDKMYAVAKSDDQNNGNCDYPSRNICGKYNDVKPKFGDYICRDIKCSETAEYPNLDYTGRERNSGESWCLYDSPSGFGFGYDAVGSRHNRAVCINGEELIEPCRDYREEFCIQNMDINGKLIQKEQFLKLGNDYSEAMCRTNRFDECSKCNDFLAADPKKALKCCNDISKRDCYWEQGGLGQAGQCVPLVPPGLKFWDASASEDYCAEASQQCTVYFYKPGTGELHIGPKKGWNVIGNEICTQKAWAIAGNTICKSQGDCGAWFNMQNRITTDGFDSTLIKFGGDFYGYELTEKDVSQFSLVNQPKAEKYKKTSEFLKRGLYPVAIGLVSTTIVWAAFTGEFIPLALSPYYGTILEGISRNTAGTLAGQTSGAIAAELELAYTATAEQVFSKEVGKQVTEAVVNSLVEQGFAKETLTKAGIEVGKKITSETAAKQLAANVASEQAAAETGGFLWGFAIPFINFLMWVYLVYQIADTIGAKQEKKLFETTCMPWEAPSGGNDCELCNTFIGGCSEYRCKSLGKSCQLINEGTTDEKCVWVSQYDTKAPAISADPKQYKEKYGYTIIETKGLGFKIKELVKPFTPVNLEMQTDEPAHCKFSTEPNKNFKELEFNFGTASLVYNHSITFSLPSNMTDPEMLKITNGGNYDLYVKCEDSNGNSNIKDYFIKFSIDKGPDMTPPKVEIVSIPANSFIPHDAEVMAISILISEPADCRWDTMNKNFESMQNNFVCAQSAFDFRSIYYGLYECTTTLDIREQINNYFFKCKDKSERANTMTEPYKYTLKSTVPLEITSAEPKGEVTTENPILRAVTAKGAEDGIAVCGYSETPNLALTEIPMFQNTNSTAHEQQLLGLQARTYKYYITCIDIAGNQANSETAFEVAVDLTPPKIIQIYIDNNLLHIITSESAQCEYAHTDFSFGAGTSMTGTINHESALDSEAIAYYIKCQDEHDNIMSSTIYP